MLVYTPTKRKKQGMETKGFLKWSQEGGIVGGQDGVVGRFCFFWRRCVFRTTLSEDGKIHSALWVWGGGIYAGWWVVEGREWKDGS